MQKLFPEETHTSILSHAVLGLVILLAGFFAFFSPARAACTLTQGTCGSLYACSYNRNGTLIKYCCNNDVECTAQKASIGATSTSNSVQSSGVLAVDPEDGCSGGVNTALGCIPYETKGFTSSLLGFLVGVVGLIALLVMLFATIMIMTGGANPEQVKKGKELFTGGITGLFFIIFSVTLLRIIAGDIIQLPGF